MPPINPNVPNMSSIAGPAIYAPPTPGATPPAMPAIQTAPPPEPLPTQYGASGTWGSGASGTWGVPQPAMPAMAQAPTMPQQQQQDDYTKYLQQGLQQQMQGTQAMAQAQAKRAQEEAAYYGEWQKQLDKFEADRKARHDAAVEGVNQKKLDFDSAAKNYSEGKVDPNHMWSSMGSANKALAALSIGLGTMGSSFTGTPNYSLQVINDAINRDIDAQKADMEKRRGMVTMKQTAYQMARDVFEDDEMATIGARMYLNQTMQNKLAQITATTQSDVVKGNAQAIQGQLLQGYAKDRVDLGTKVYDANLKGMEAAAKAQEKFGPSAEEVKSANQLAVHKRNIDRLIDENIALSEGGVTYPLGTTAHKIDANNKQLQLELMKYNEFGTKLTGAAKEMFAPPDVSSIIPFKTERKTEALMQLKRNIRKGYETTLKQIGASPVGIQAGERVRPGAGMSQPPAIQAPPSGAVPAKAGASPVGMQAGERVGPGAGMSQPPAIQAPPSGAVPAKAGAKQEGKKFYVRVK